MAKKPGTYVEVLGGVEGPCLAVMQCDSDGGASGERVAGPKPWGGSTGTLHSFAVDVDAMAKALDSGFDRKKLLCTLREALDAVHQAGGALISLRGNAGHAAVVESLEDRIRALGGEEFAVDTPAECEPFRERETYLEAESLQRSEGGTIMHRFGENDSWKVFEG